MTDTQNKQVLAIRGLAVFSSVGICVDSWKEALVRVQAPSEQVPGISAPVFQLHASAQDALRDVFVTPRYNCLDRTAHMALACSRQTVRAIQDVSDIGLIAVGSSRGPTMATEAYYSQMLESGTKLSPLASPVTTSGSIASWIGQDLFRHLSPESRCQRLATLSTSMTCTSAFHSLLVSKAFVESGMAQVALFGGSEAPLTAFTFAQIDALRIASKDAGMWPCRPCAERSCQPSGLVLGEAVGMALLQKVAREDLRDGDLVVLGVGWGQEKIESPTGISKEGFGIESAMRDALKGAGGDAQVDAVILHAPGTALGDTAELAAVRRVFGGIPVRTTKHLTGHTYGASGMVSLQLAQYLLHLGQWPGVQYPAIDEMLPKNSTRPSQVLINTAGFGGSAVSLLIARAS